MAKPSARLAARALSVFLRAFTSISKYRIATKIKHHRNMRKGAWKHGFVKQCPLATASLGTLNYESG
jgi:hypothetical protein